MRTFVENLDVPDHHIGQILHENTRLILSIYAQALNDLTVMGRNNGP